MRQFNSEVVAKLNQELLSVIAVYTEVVQQAGIQSYRLLAQACSARNQFANSLDQLRVCLHRI